MNFKGIFNKGELQAVHWIPLYKKFRVLGKIYRISLNEGLEENKGLVFTKIKI
jgi:hypothetical protein